MGSPTAWPGNESARGAVWTLQFSVRSGESVSGHGMVQPRFPVRNPFTAGVVMSIVKLRVNGATHSVDVDPSTPLLYVLRNDLDLHGPRFGCGLGQCSVCT